MYLDDPFPIGTVSSRTRAAILHEFKGRCPSIREMTQISDKRLLATPGIGLSALEAIRSIAEERPSETAPPSSAGMSDAELLGRLEKLQKELQGIRTMLKGRMAETSRITN